MKAAIDLLNIRMLEAHALLLGNCGSDISRDAILQQAAAMKQSGITTSRLIALQAIQYTVRPCDTWSMAAFNMLQEQVIAMIALQQVFESETSFLRRRSATTAYLDAHFK